MWIDFAGTRFSQRRVFSSSRRIITRIEKFFLSGGHRSESQFCTSHSGASTSGASASGASASGFASGGGRIGRGDGVLGSLRSERADRDALCVHRRRAVGLRSVAVAAHHCRPHIRKSFAYHLTTILRPYLCSANRPRSKKNPIFSLNTVLGKKMGFFRSKLVGIHFFWRNQSETLSEPDN